jgi:UDP-N-acetylmuramoylalanine--D-glutamate ligase
VEQGVYADGPALIEVHDGKRQPPISLDGIRSLRGQHNWQNAAAAFALARSQGLSAAEIAAGLKTFPGLAHRMEEVGRAGRVLFINDSKATNADAASKALAAFEPIYWIAGGLPKSDGIDGLDAFYPRITKAYLIGEAAGAFAAKLGGAVDHVIAGTLDEAVAQAARDAARSDAAEPVVLLSPACASYDQFKNFAERGDAFRATVAGLSGVTMREREAA